MLEASPTWGVHSSFYAHLNVFPRVCFRPTTTTGWWATAAPTLTSTRAGRWRTFQKDIRKDMRTVQKRGRKKRERYWQIPKPSLSIFSSLKLFVVKFRVSFYHKSHSPRGFTSRSPPFEYSHFDLWELKKKIFCVFWYCYYLVDYCWQ